MSESILKYQEECADKWASREEALDWLKKYRPASLSYKILSEASRTLEKTGNVSRRLEDYVFGFRNSYQFDAVYKSSFRFDAVCGYYVDTQNRVALTSDFLFVKALRFFPKLSLYLSNQLNAVKVNNVLYESFFKKDEVEEHLSGILDNITTIEFFLADKLSYQLRTSYPNIPQVIKYLQELYMYYIKKSEEMYITLNKQFIEEGYVVFPNLMYLKNHINLQDDMTIMEVYISQDSKSLRVLLE